MTPKDQNARDSAIDPTLSAIVQAPAGSGKTELLTQRFLNLLCTVQAPEQVVALTFTRKAAFEMRERILDRLKTAPHALKHDQKHHWQLLKNPSRLRVTTLDSLCQRLTEAMPLQEKHIPFAHITDTPDTLYFEAARACLHHALQEASYQDAITVLLEHLDNRTDTLLNLFVTQLKKRDQWLKPVLQARLQDKSHLESAIYEIEQHALTQLKQAVPNTAASELIRLASSLAALEPCDSPRACLENWQSLEALTREHAAALASLLLTSQKKFRKAFDHHVGLKRDKVPKDTYQMLKADSKSLLETLASTPGFRQALLRARALPHPTYPKEDWAPLQALLTLLPLLAGHLQLIFEATQSIDFTGVTHQALDALGEDTAPTDLALYLDYSIQHLLIDEFQDTSMQQFELIKRLTRGFESGDGRTLFVVGDPMQSIYRFRAAEVGLFLQAQQEGIGEVKLTPLYLTANFRSNTPLVNWVNQQFRNIFPVTDDLASGAVSFHKAEPTKVEHETLIEAFEYASSQHEAQAIAACCKKHLAAHKEQNIAILVRARTQLPAIIEALDDAGIPYQGLDTDAIATLPHIKDVLSLTKALLMPAHRLAWLAFLRSPWCGLTLSDLHRIANHAPQKPILLALEHSDCIQSLTQSGQLRIKAIYPILKKALNTRHQLPLTNSILDVLKALHFEAVLTPDELLDLDIFWETLAQFEEDGLISDMHHFETQLNQRYAKQLGDAPVQLMTIHKSKGLEFDTVILPGLGKRAPNPEKPLLRWLTLPYTAEEDLILISPLHAAHNKSAVLYDYLGTIEAEKNQYEQARLLYVAATRAKRNLYLFDHKTTVTDGTFRAALQEVVFTPAKTNITEPNLSTYPMRKYLPDSFYTAKKMSITEEKLNPPMALPELTPARALGVITHNLLEWMCTHHPLHLHDIPWHLTTPDIKALGLSADEEHAAIQQIKTWITTCFHHPRGQWIIKKHTQEATEYPVLIQEKNRLVTRVIDRLFEDNGIFWIIDFKTGQKNPNSHTLQLNQYANALREHTKLPIHCGLFYLETTDWVEWATESECVTMPEPN